MVTDKRTANAVGGKTARACECCVRRRARWYCAADDAFLCESCDVSVHSANSLAGRHERLRLTTSSSSSHRKPTCLPTWRRGINSKPRTPRHGKKKTEPEHDYDKVPCFTSVVPQIDDDDYDQSNNFNCYRVPLLDSVFAETEQLGESVFVSPNFGIDNDEFVADVENLLRNGLDGEISYGIEELGLLDNFHEIGDSIQVPVKGETEEEMEILKNEERIICLKLDYDAIRRSWGSKGSPWLNGVKPEINAIDDDDNYFSNLVTMEHGDCGFTGQRNEEVEKREERVMRYKEKRRKRLFSKKIRYEVRKLNAEKRPRFKGRFVKSLS